jgi:S1-C subfamily serine protease
MLEDSGFGTPVRRRGSGNVFTHAIMAVLGAALAGGLLLAFYGPASGGSLPGIGAVPSAGSSPARLTGGQRGIVAKVEPGVVIIRSALQYNSEAAAGTGMVINAGGLVLTNNHVIEDSTGLTATVAPGRTYRATVIGYDKTGDIALLQLQKASGLTTVPIGDSSSARIGKTVVAMGNAEGRGTITAAPGHVTGLHQTITASDKGGSTTSEVLRGMIQINADIVPGDSGGPLASSAGVIGMDTAGNNPGYQQASTGFAIPINRALSVARQIAAGHASSVITIGYPPFMGIFIGSGSAKSPQAQARQQGQGTGGSRNAPACSTSNADLTVPSVIAPVSSGALIDGTICGSPAAKAGLTGGAVITAVNGQPVGSPANLTGILSRFHPGDTISVIWVSPSGQRTTSNLHLTAGPPQ